MGHLVNDEALAGPVGVGRDVLYEFVFLAQNALSSHQVEEGLMNELSSMLTRWGANVVKREYWGLRDLAYKVKKLSKAHYFRICVYAKINVIEEFKRRLKLHEDVIRHLCVVVDSVSDTGVVSEDEGE